MAKLFKRQNDEQIFRNTQFNPLSLFTVGLFKEQVYQRYILNLADFTEKIALHVSVILAHELHNVVKSVVHYMQFLEQCDEGHIKQYMQ